MASYTYNGNTYSTKKELRKAVWTAEHKTIMDYTAYEATAEDTVATASVSASSSGRDVNAVRAERLSELERSFTEWADKEAVMQSSLGFRAKADQRSMGIYIGLAVIGEGATVTDADGIEHTLEDDEMSRLARDAVMAQKTFMTLYDEKKTLVEEAETADAVDAVSLEWEAYEA